MVHLLFKLIVYPTTLLLIMYGNVGAESVCQQEEAVMRWDLSEYSSIGYAYIQHGDTLIATISSSQKIIIEVAFEKRVVVKITEALVIELTIYNVTIADNGTYTCTCAFGYGSKERKTKQELAVKDPDIAISFRTADDRCNIINCSSKYNVTLLGPTGKHINNKACLPQEDIGNYACCLLDRICKSSFCKFININIDDHNSVYTQKTTPYEAKTGDVDMVEHIIIFGVCQVPSLTLLICVFIFFLIKNRRNVGIINKLLTNCQADMPNTPYMIFKWI